MSRLSAAVLLLAGSLGCSSAPVPTVLLDPVRVAPPGEGGVGRLAFMVGCWRTPPGEAATLLEERWSPGEGGVMLGTSRFVRDGRVVSFEFGLIRQSGDSIALLPHPGGVASEHLFGLTISAPGEAVFEAPENDYPRRISYTLRDGRLEAMIDGGADDPSPRRWMLAPIACG